MPRIALLLCLLLALPADAQDLRRFTDSAGRQVQVPARVQRVYAAGPPASVVLLALAPDTLTGWTRAFRPDEAAFVPRRYADLPDLGRLTGRGNTANVEVLLKERPDLIVDLGATAPTFASLADRVQQQTGIPYVLLDGRFEATPAAFRALGTLLGQQARAEILARYFEKTLADIRQRLATVPANKRPRAYYGRGANGLQTAPSGSISVEVLDFLGAQNVAGAGPGGLAGVSLEQVLAWNPEVVFTSDPNFYASIWKDARWSGVAAVKARRVHLSPHLPFGWFDFPPGANRLIGLWWAAGLLYPEAFKDDLRPRIKEFYKLFYQQEPADRQVDALLSEPGVMPR